MKYFYTKINLFCNNQKQISPAGRITVDIDVLSCLGHNGGRWLQGRAAAAIETKI